MSAADARPCVSCGAAGLDNFGYCAAHLGVGMPGRSAEACDLTCAACAATWVGFPDETCAWCERFTEQLLDWQREMVLQPPDVGPDDAGAEVPWLAWGDRMRAAINVGIITADEARKTWRQAVRHANP